jgi:hypothetical protein
MVDVVKGLFGSSDQEKLLKRQNRELRAAEAGQRTLREGGRGLLAYIEDELGTLGGNRTRGLVKTLGGTY